MNTHFCKVGKITTKVGKVLGILDLEKEYNNRIEHAYNVKQTDANLSDTLYFEAYILKRNILKLKRLNSNNFDAAI